mmetsp:Transcript_21142/g.52085  ORF Transcript_21142/g.52085 Transcript_21142/m.52085 type:complete len:107 (-) Transcript_21142:198-518(-)
MVREGDEAAEKRRSFILGEHPGSEYFRWGMGELICGKCLRDSKPRLYLCRANGRRTYCTEEYFEKYWSGKDREFPNHMLPKLLRTPKDHQEMMRPKAQKKPRAAPG